MSFTVFNLQFRAMKRCARSAATVLVILVAASIVAAQTMLKLLPRKHSEVELALGKKSVIFDLDDALTGTNGVLPGDPPHRYRVMFTAAKGDFFYLVANVRSASPITSPTAPCGGDSPQSILWIKADKTLKNREVQSEIYASCSYNYYESKVKQDKKGITILFGGNKKIELRYDNDHPEDGLVIKTLST